MLKKWEGRLLGDTVYSSEESAISRIKQYNNVDARGGFGQTFLHEAVWANYQVACQLLIDNKADVNAKDNSDRTPLMYAAAAGIDEELRRLLIDNGADINARNHKRRTPLMYAARNGRENMCTMLIARGANYNARDYEGCTVLWQSRYRARPWAASDTAILRAIAKLDEVPWTANNHHTRPKRVKQAVYTLMLLRQVDSTGLHMLPRELMFQLFQWLRPPVAVTTAYPRC
jgi:hypothetical protein